MNGNNKTDDKTVQHKAGPINEDLYAVPNKIKSDKVSEQDDIKSLNSVVEPQASGKESGWRKALASFKNFFASFSNKPYQDLIISEESEGSSVDKKDNSFGEEEEILEKQKAAVNKSNSTLDKDIKTHDKTLEEKPKQSNVIMDVLNTVVQFVLRVVKGNTHNEITDSKLSKSNADVENKGLKTSNAVKKDQLRNHSTPQQDAVISEFRAKLDAAGKVGSHADKITKGREAANNKPGVNTPG